MPGALGYATIIFKHINININNFIEKKKRRRTITFFTMCNPMHLFKIFLDEIYWRKPILFFSDSSLEYKR